MGSLIHRTISIAATEILSLSEENSKGLVSTSDSHTMSFLKQLEEKKNALKKAEVSRKENTGPQEMIMKETEDYYRMLKETYFEAYYDQIEEYTFKSVIIPMTIDDTKALMDAHTKFMDGTDKEVNLKVVDAKIDEGIKLIREKANKNCKVFVRLSSRSPKDAIYHLESFPTLIQEKLSSFESDQEDLYSKLHAFYMASTEIMAVSNGREATDLMGRSNRIQGDMEEAVKNELRGFVYKGIFTALTQYNNLAYFPEHIDGKAEVEEKVKSFVKVFIKAMESVLDSFVMDIVVDDAGKVWVVEVNPFGEMAGSCLFEWSRDRAILMGREPFQFRIVDQPPPLGLIKTEVDPRVLEVLGIH